MNKFKTISLAALTVVLCIMFFLERTYNDGSGIVTIGATIILGWLEISKYLETKSSDSESEVEEIIDPEDAEETMEDDPQAIKELEKEEKAEVGGVN